MQIFIDLVFPILGVCIIILSVASFFFRFGDKLKDRVQEISMFGVDLKISLITLLIFVGLALSGVGIYLSKWGDVEKLKELEQEKMGLEQKLAQEQKKQARILLKLEGAKVEDVDKLQEWECEYLVSGSASSNWGQLLRGYSEGSFAALLSDVNQNTTVWSLTVKNIRTNKKWSFKQPFIPLQPTIQLTADQ